MYNNINGQFTEVETSIVLTHQGESAWGDYDNDGDLDLVTSGFNSSDPTLRLYNNENGVFEEIAEQRFIGVYNSSLKWGDFDNDGDLDILVMGSQFADGQSTLRIYENKRCEFVPIEIALFGGLGEVAWGDYDNDGDLDILATSDCAPCGELVAAVTRLYENSDGVFVDAQLDIVQLNQGSVAWGDYDNDGDLDFIVSGFTRPAGSVKALTKIYRNNLVEAGFEQNIQSLPPSELASNVSGNAVILAWKMPQSDTEGNLSSNILLENIDKGLYIISPQ